MTRGWRGGRRETPHWGYWDSRQQFETLPALYELIAATPLGYLFTRWPSVWREGKCSCDINMPCVPSTLPIIILPTALKDVFILILNG